MQQQAAGALKFKDRPTPRSSDCERGTHISYPRPGCFLVYLGQSPGHIARRHGQRRAVTYGPAGRYTETCRGRTVMSARPPRPSHGQQAGVETEKQCAHRRQLLGGAGRPLPVSLASRALAHPGQLGWCLDQRASYPTRHDIIASHGARLVHHTLEATPSWMQVVVLPPCVIGCKLDLGMLGALHTYNAALLV